jgi:hypothetical protein
MTGSDRVRAASRASYVVAVAGLVGVVTIGLFLSVGEPFGTLNDLSLIVMTLALAVVMLGFAELGTSASPGLARAAFVGGLVAVAVWTVVEVAFVLGLAHFDYTRASSGAMAIEMVAQIGLGLWLLIGNWFAGAWLPRWARWVGLGAGLGFVLLGAGLLLGGQNHPLSYLGGIGYEVLFPLWAFLAWRVLRVVAAGAAR